VGSFGCGTNWPSDEPLPDVAMAQMPIELGTSVLVGAGDISKCDELDSARSTAALLAKIDGDVFVAGDGSNDHGTSDEYANCFATTWGHFDDRIHPTPGNHDYATAGASGYFDYYGPAAGENGKGWYSYDLGKWHVVVLNSNCDQVGGCEKGSPQETWLREDLAAHPAQCTIAYWHHPMHSSGEHGNDARTADFWRALYESGAELVLNGHDHDFERFVPLDPDGQPDPERGIRQFVVGTGGAPLRSVNTASAGSDRVITGQHGVLRLVLRDGAYDWQFIGTDGSVLDSGTGVCH
jgi:hypothetical protein